MPTYQYACEACGEDFEVVQSFTDDTLTSHTTGCGGAVHKRFGGIAVAFKGSGFYRNDSRENGGTPAAAKSESSSGSSSDSVKSDAKGDSSSSATKTESTPAPKTESKPAASSTSTSSSSTPAA